MNITQILIFGTLCVLGLYDIFALMYLGEDATISRFMQNRFFDSPFATFVIGVCLITLDFYFQGRRKMNKWIPHFFYKKFDGGQDSGVTGYFLIEWKPVFSVGILHFKRGSREAFHEHAFNALSWFIKGKVTEEKLDGIKKDFLASFKPKFTPRSCFHKVIAHVDTYALTLRGPWVDTWREFRPRSNSFVTLTHGRQVVDSTPAH